MPTFLSRRYMRRPDQVGTTEKVLGGCLLILLAAIVGTYMWQSATNEDYLFDANEAGSTTGFGDATAGAETALGTAHAENPFPAPGVDGWQAPPRPSRFTPQDLYKKINGRAELYLQFHVVGLTFGTYSHQTDRQRTIDVYWYDMGEPKNALGIYRSEAPEHAAAVTIGRDGYQTGGAVFFLKGSSYVQVLPTGPDETDGPVALEIAKRIGEKINASGKALWALKVLPQAGRVAVSFEYLAEDAFGLDFLRDVFAANYDRNGCRVKLFIHRAEDAASARALFDQYLGYFEEYGTIVWTDPDGSRSIAAGDAAGVVDVVFAKARYFGGVAGAEELEPAKQAAVAFYNELAVP